MPNALKLLFSLLLTGATIDLAAGCAEAGRTESSLPGRDAAAGEPGSDLDAGVSVPAVTLDSGSGVIVMPGDECNQLELSFEPQIPSVFILVDRSSSMFERGLWEPLKRGVLAIVEQLDRDIRFGFASYTGVAGGMCPDLTGRVLVADDNYDAIKSAYDRITAPTYKGETPTSRAVDEVSALLAAQSSGPKFILLVTDGEPDFCDDPNVTCSRDAVVASVQAAHGQGIGSFIFSVGGSVDRAHLQDVANAGRGEGVQDRQQSVFQQCNGGRASYMATAGSAPFFEPNVQDQQALVSALSSVVAGVRSCVFELSGKLEIDPGAANMGVVEIDGTRVPYGEPDGFRMNSRTQLELLGASCARLRRPETKNVAIDFPCMAVIVL